MADEGTEPTSTPPVGEQSPLGETTRTRSPWVALSSFSLFVVVFGIAYAAINWNGTPAKDEQSHKPEISFIATATGQLPAPENPRDQLSDDNPVKALMNGQTRSPLQPDELFRRTSPAVVQVVTYVGRVRSGGGSGFVVSREGLIATNYHVIEKASTVEVVLADGRTFEVPRWFGAFGVGRTGTFDKEADIAIINIGSSLEMSPLELDGSELPIGTKVYAIGNPFGLANTLSDGLVSGFREIDRIRVIQTSAPISPGSSGGPLLRADGRVVGVTSSGLKGGQNLNFAVPASQVARQLQKSLALHHMKRGGGIAVIR